MEIFPQKVAPQSPDEHASLRYGALNHWRGLAALMVVGFHTSWALTWAGNDAYVLPYVRRICSVGWWGVHMFFVISGYCIAANVHYRTARQPSAYAFIKDRFLRIYPLYWGALIMSFGMGLVAAHLSRSGADVKWLPTPLGFLTNLALVEPYCGTHSGLIVSWTLVYEVGFYLLVALGLLGATHCFTARIWVGAGVGLAFLSFFGLPQPAFLMLNYWPEFVCGALVYLARLENLRGHQTSQWLYLATIPALAVADILFSHFDHKWTLPGAAGFALLLYFLAALDRQILQLRWLRWLGVCGAFSYSLYLIHAPLLVRMNDVVHRLVSPGSPWLILVFTAMWCLAVLGGYCFYRICEVPLEKWRRHSRSDGHKSLPKVSVAANITAATSTSIACPPVK
jgi:peptidoglycan/LPS O-acetylase OafA/YrhL